jgi:uncharacterized membrane protein
MNDDVFFHYPPALFELLINAVHYLNRGKKGVFIFFQGAGVPDKIISPVRKKWEMDHSIAKREIARQILTALNQGGDIYLRQRREIIKRIIEFDDFSLCYPDDLLPAKGVVSEIQQIVLIRNTAMRIIIDAERERIVKQKLREEEIAKKIQHKENISKIRNELFSLFSETNPQKRGKKLETVLNNLFKTYGISIREAFTLVGDNAEGIVEQIDGVIEISGEIYFVEMKWWSDPLGVPQISEHLVRIYHRAEARAIIISASNFTEPAVSTCKDALQQKIVVLCTLQEIVFLLEKEKDLLPFLKQKIHAAQIDKNPFAGICLD